MKIRTGFVSNSSSSSFVIATRAEDENGFKEILMKYLALPEGHPLENVPVLMCDIMLEYGNMFSGIDEILKNSPDAFYDDDPLGGYDGFKRAEVEKLFRKGFKIFRGEVTDEEGGLEAFVCRNVGFDIEEEDLILKKDKGY